MRDSFFSVAAHELRTPLTSLLGQAQLLQRRAARDGTLNERDRHAVDVLVSQAQRLNKLIISLLDISRLQQGRLALDIAPLDLNQLVERMLAELRPVVDSHTLVRIGEHQPLLVAGDALRLEQALQNLIGNAVKYSPEGSTVTIQLGRQGGLASVAVTDRGIGIPREALPHLFEQFYRAPNVDHQRGSGLGIGLYVVHEIVALHAGRVEVASVEGHGSTFTITLPLSDTAEG
jgi:signal transduction histidine kinase